MCIDFFIPKIYKHTNVVVCKVTNLQEVQQRGIISQNYLKLKYKQEELIFDKNKDNKTIDYTAFMTSHQHHKQPYHRL